MRRELSVWRDPFELGNPWQDMASVFNDFLSSRDWPAVRMAGPSGTHPKIDSYLDNNTLHIKAELPGVDPKDVEISLDGNRLTLKGERKVEKEDQAAQGYFHKELSYGSFSRSFVLPNGIDASKIEAAAKNGILEVTVPLPETVFPKRVTVQVRNEDASAAA